MSNLSVYQPMNLSEAQNLAKMLATAGLVPQAFRGKPNDILLVMARGADLGLSPVQSLHAFFVINGRVGMYSDALVGVVIGKSFCRYFRLVSSDDKAATYETLREGNPEPVRLSYTMEQAKAAGLTSNATYQKHPAAMLRARCSAALARATYPDLVAGIYEPSELEEIQPAAHLPVSRAVVAPNASPPADVVHVEPGTGEIWDEAPLMDDGFHRTDIDLGPPDPPDPEVEELRMPDAVKKHAGKPLGALTTSDLKWWAKAFAEGAEKPDKERWRDQNLALAAGCLAELAKRGEKP